MSVFSLLLLILIGLGLWYVVQKLKELEREIRRDIEEKNRLSPAPASDRSNPRDEPVPEQRVEAPPVQSTAAAPSTGPLSPQERVLELIRRQPGVLQTELYLNLADLPSRQLQNLLLRLDRESLISREKSGGSYRLYPG